MSMTLYPASETLSWVMSGCMIYGNYIKERHALAGV